MFSDNLLVLCCNKTSRVHGFAISLERMPPLYFFLLKNKQPNKGWHRPFIYFRRGSDNLRTMWMFVCVGGVLLLYKATL